MHYITALSVGAIVCIAAANAGTTSQDSEKLDIYLGLHRDYNSGPLRLVQRLRP